MTTTRHTMMPTSLLTPRLRLRAPVLADASRIAMFIGDWDVAKMLGRVPYPYTEQDAVRWITEPTGEQQYVVVHANGVIGVVGVSSNAAGEYVLGYWLAKPFWGRGLMSEAASAVMKALRACDPKGVVSVSHAVDNPASGAIIAKLGFLPTGERLSESRSRGETVRTLTYRLALVAPPRPEPALIPV